MTGKAKCGGGIGSRRRRHIAHRLTFVVSTLGLGSAVAWNATLYLPQAGNWGILALCLVASLGWLSLIGWLDPPRRKNKRKA